MAAPPTLAASAHGVSGRRTPQHRAAPRRRPPSGTAHAAASTCAVSARPDPAHLTRVGPGAPSAAGTSATCRACATLTSATGRACPGISFAAAASATAASVSATSAAAASASAASAGASTRPPQPPQPEPALVAGVPILSSSADDGGASSVTPQHLQRPRDHLPDADAGAQHARPPARSPPPRPHSRSHPNARHRSDTSRHPRAAHRKRPRPSIRPPRRLLACCCVPSIIDTRRASSLASGQARPRPPSVWRTRCLPRSPPSAAEQTSCLAP